MAVTAQPMLEGLLIQNQHNATHLSCQPPAPSPPPPPHLLCPCPARRVMQSPSPLASQSCFSSIPCTIPAPPPFRPLRLLPPATQAVLDMSRHLSTAGTGLHISVVVLQRTRFVDWVCSGSMLTPSAVCPGARTDLQGSAGLPCQRRGGAHTRGPG